MLGRPGRRAPALGFLLGVVGTTCGAGAQAGDWVLVPGESTIGFQGTMMGVAVPGRFERFEATIHFDPEALSEARVLVRINMASANTDHDERDTALKLPEWFDAAAYPYAEFETHDIRHRSGNAYEAVGMLHIRDKSRKVKLPFSLEIDGGTTHMSGTLTLNRRDFDIGTGEWKSSRIVDHEVRVDVSITALAQP